MMRTQPVTDELSYFLPGTNGHGVLLIHGVTGAPGEMKLVARRLNKAGYSVSVPLLAGHGADVETLRRSNWENWYDSVRVAADLLRNCSDAVFAGGICVGGMLALRLAHDFAKLSGVAVFSPTIHYDGWNAPFYYALGPLGLPLVSRLKLIRWFEFAERHPFGIKSDRIRKLVAAPDMGIRGTLPVFPASTVLENYRLFWRVRKVLHEIKTPTLLIHALKDDVSSPKNALFIREKIGGRCEIEWLNDSYHMIHLDQEHPKVADRTARFFGSLVEPA
jgi:carboxylesterase